MKKFTFKGVLDGFRQQVQPQMVKPEQEIPETLRPEHFQLKKVSFFEHNFNISYFVLSYSFWFSSELPEILCNAFLYGTTTEQTE